MNLLRLLTSPLPVPASWYAIPLRLIVGLGFIQHGYAKLARGPEDFIGVLHAGTPSSFLLGWLTIIVELVCGLMILVGPARRRLQRAAGYYPECNPLLPLWHHAEGSHVPAAKVHTSARPQASFKSTGMTPLSSLDAFLDFELKHNS